MEKFPGQALQLAAGQLLSVAGISLAWAVWDAHGVMPDLSFFATPSIAAALAYTGLVTTALAVYLETIALQKVSAAEVSFAVALAHSRRTRACVLWHFDDLLL
jgi:drug/metabolite transporter (DMT)-like permease